MACLKSQFDVEIQLKKDVLIQSIYTAIFEDLRNVQTCMKSFDTNPSFELIRALPKKLEGVNRLILEANQHLKAIEVFYDDLCKAKEKAAREIFKTKQT